MKSNKLPDASSVASFLLESSHTQELSQWIKQTLSQLALKGPNELAQAKTGLATALGQLVDAQDSFMPPAAPEKPVLVIERVRKTIAQKTVKKKASSTSLGLTSPKSLLSTKSFEISKRERANFSQFGLDAHSITFNKARRKTDQGETRSPGPAYYSSFRSSLKKAPAARMPTEKTKRSSFLKLKKNPGPSDYYPSKHYLAK